MGAHSRRPEPLVTEPQRTGPRALKSVDELGLEAWDSELATEAYILLKVRSDDGGPNWSYRSLSRISREELLGALTVQGEVLRRELRDDWKAEEF